MKYESHKKKLEVEIMSLKYLDLKLIYLSVKIENYERVE